MELNIKTLALFFAAAILEIAGAYLVWRWIRERKKLIFGLFGGFMLFIYAVIPTLQPAHFARVYAAYGGIFIVSSILWGAIVDKKQPDRYELIGAFIALIGVLVIFYVPR